VFEVMHERMIPRSARSSDKIMRQVKEMEPARRSGANA
jgi:hypothetical protein